MKQLFSLGNSTSRFSKYLPVLFGSLVLSCGTLSDKNVTEGIIEYDAVPVDKNNTMASMAPSKMTVKFKDNKASVQMSAGMGLFNTMFITNPENRSMTQLVKFLNKKTALVLDSSKVIRDNHAAPFEIAFKSETKMIAGYLCKKAMVKPKDGSQKPFEVFYTEEIGIENPNYATPFYPIKGVLMEYRMTRYGLELKFTATRVKKDKVDDSEFILPPDYRMVSEEEMKDLFMSLQ